MDYSWSLNSNPELTVAVAGDDHRNIFITLKVGRERGMDEYDSDVVAPGMRGLALYRRIHLEIQKHNNDTSTI